MTNPKDAALRAEGEQTQSRKKDHVDIVLKEDVRARRNAWDDVQLMHEAVPEVDFHDIDLTTLFLKKPLKAPVMVASMTGGYPDAERINGNLAAAAAELGLALGVGSQRAALTRPNTRRSYTVVRDHEVPFVAANIGAPQIIAQGDRKPLTRAEIDELIKMIRADALIVHLNYLQEAVMPEGDLAAEGVLGALRDLANDLATPIIVKETGAGMRRRTAHRLKGAGARALDVGGVGGTTFAAVEQVRARTEGVAPQARLGDVFRDWGNPTPVSLLETQGVLPLIGTGGLRHGLDVARALALGASLGGIASAGLRHADAGAEHATAYFRQVLLELRTACFLTGSRRAADLGRAQAILLGETRERAIALGHSPEAYALHRSTSG
ncbi:MAG TPA: type 2 isopentenyl-diphosphate Delta-isomerase [Candidatus Thermoplasmatota archaeon]|nr:type 2 isopentenyl-diphosphate Delta-isomerase [Candidatus Thermoplasmatota archaeon]